MSGNSGEKGWQPLGSPGRRLPPDRALVVLSDSDHVGVVARDVRKGEDLGGVAALEDIPKGHKIALADVPAGTEVRKYSQVIGVASSDIKAGTHVHTHNLGFSAGGARDLAACSEATETVLVPEGERATFMGYRRPGGRVGTRNYVAVVSSVNCSATAARRIAARFEGEALRDFPNVDGVAAFIHATGCGLSADGDGIGVLHRLMQGYAGHPNVAGAVLLGLGCESNQIGGFLAERGLAEGEDLITLGIQTCGGLSKAVGAGAEAVESLLERANRLEREPCSADGLTLALQCGGSDAWSGITANPALGHAADMLVAQGGTAVIAETPEAYGAEHLLTRRASTPEVAGKLADKIRWWEEHAARGGGTMDNNPSPGNKLGGLTTILEKSLGAVAKGGTTSLNGFYEYGERVTERGFVMMDSPGYDPVSVTGQIASGCNLVAFTTGRGSAFGSKPAPTLKICSNPDTYARMPEDMDVNAGAILTDGRSVAEVGEEIFARLLTLASGEASLSELQGMGDHEFVPWQLETTM